jgi:transaldolase/glucose-6-phosphate isomerase
MTGIDQERRGGRWELSLGRHAAAVEARLAQWQRQELARRLWQRDPTLWSAQPVPEIVDRLGWLELPTAMRAEVPRLASLTTEVSREGMRDAVVLGMGGSSLAPEVFARTFGPAPGHPELGVLDSTHPRAVRALAERLAPLASVFLVSSKSGTTTEMLSFFYTFWAKVGEALEARGSREGAGDRGRHFIAITDPGTPLQKLAEQRGFRAVFNAPPDVGGRYSALTPFGLVPAALLGVDLELLLARGRAMAAACGPQVPAAENPGLCLGAALGELTRAGRDKVTLVPSPGLAAFPDWLEQLIAESTGKDGRGIVPVAGEELGRPEVYGDDRFFVALTLAGESSGIEDRLAALEQAGHPVARFELADAADLGGEMFRWEVAVAAASAAIGVHPFNQPDVQFAKELASKAMKQRAAGGPGGSAGPAGADGVPAADAAALDRALSGWLADAGAGSYLGIQAYLPPTPATTRALHEAQRQLRDRTRFATTVGYGPRFLHSTGQLHKGGPGAGRFLQLVDEPGEDLAVPETSYTYGTLIRAQADGDRQAMEQRGRRVLRVDLGGDAAGGLAALAGAIARLRPAPGTGGGGPSGDGGGGARS